MQSKNLRKSRSSQKNLKAGRSEALMAPPAISAGVGEFARCHGSPGVKLLVQSKRIADSDHRDAGCTPEVGQHLTDECVEFAFINLGRIIYVRHRTNSSGEN